MPKINLDGQEVEAPAGKTVLQVALERGIQIPVFCWHPGLSVAANCRMCLVKQTLQGRSSLVPSCATVVADGMAIETSSADVLAARKGVLEFLLANHPLDCPQCDCAGECMLQDNAFEHGKDRSRFVEQKVTKTRTTFGPLVHYWGSRCIVCTRCVRFTDEISGTGELAVINRGDHSEISTFPTRPLDNPMSGCVVDLCPVGALINDDFLYQSRAWFIHETKSVCPTCSRGCNIDVDALHGVVKRLFPRHNEAVNSHWMCDEGRRNYKFLNSVDRLLSFQVREKGQLKDISAEQAIERLVAAARETRTKHGSGAIAGLGSLWQTNEEIFLYENLIMNALGSTHFGFVGLPAGATWTSRSGFVIDADRNPNRQGASWIVSPEAVAHGYDRILTELRAGRIRFLWIAAGVPGWTASAEFLAALDKVDFLVVQDILNSPLAQRAHLVIPGCAYTEKTGTWVNSQQRVQRIRRAVPGPLDATEDLAVFQRVLMGLGNWSEVFSAEAIFREITAEGGAFQGLTWADLGDLGKPATAEAAGATRQ